MADRTTKVSLVAQVTGYVAGMDQAARKTRELGSAGEKLVAQRQGMEVLGRSVLAVGTLAAVGVGLAVARFSEFDAAMSSVKAATQESASNMGLLREAALEAGGATVFTAKEAAGAIENLAKAGVATADILGGGLAGALDLAAAGELEVGRAAEIAASALTQFKLEGEDIPHVADLLAAGAGKAQGSVNDLGAALNQSGLVASQVGLTIEETSGTLAAFASAGLIGSDAGTSFRTMLLRLNPQTKEAKEQMKELGFTAYDAQGNFLGMEAVAGNLRTSLEGLTPQARSAALQIMFGQDAIRGANVLFEQGAPGIAEWTDKVNDSGYAAKVANDRLNNLSGDVEKLGGAFDTALIQTGSAANGILRDLVQSATFLIDGIADLPGPVLTAGLALGGLVAAVGLAGGAALIAIPRIADFKVGLNTLNISGRKAAIGIGLASGAIAAATFIVGHFVAAAADQAALTDELADSLDKASGATTDYTREIVKRRLAESGAFDVAEKLGVSQRDLTDAVLEGGDALDEIQRKMAGENNLVNFFNGSGVAAGNATDAIRGLENGLVGAKDKAKDMEAADEGLADSTEAVEEGLTGIGASAQDASGEISDLADQIRNFGSVTLDAREAQRQLEEALDDARDAFEENGKTLDITTAAGRANQAAMDDVAKAAADSAAATWEKTGSEEALRDSLAQSREDLIKTAVRFGKSEEAAERYADQVLATPDEVMTAVKVSGLATAESRIRDFLRLLNSVPASRQTSVGVIYRSPFQGPGKADGGAISGPGGPRDDVVPIMASNGEHILDAEDVRRMGGQAGVYAFRQALYMADGGAVQSRFYSSPSRAYSAPAATASGTGGGTGRVSGQLFLDSGAFLGAVQGVLRQQGAVSKHRDAEIGLNL